MLRKLCSPVSYSRTDSEDAHGAPTHFPCTRGRIVAVEIIVLERLKPLGKLSVAKQLALSVANL